MSINIVRNIKAFLERVDVKGPEAYAWAEAHQFVQHMLEDLSRPPATQDAVIKAE